MSATGADRQRHKPRNRAGDVVRRLVSPGELIHKSKARQGLEHVHQALVGHPGAIEQRNQDLAAACVALPDTGAFARTHDRKRVEPPDHLSVDRVEVAEHVHDRLERRITICSREGLGNSQQTSTHSQVVVDRFEEGVAVSELRIDGHTRDLGPVGHGFECEAASSDELLACRGDDAGAALAHRGGAPPQLIRARRHVAGFTVRIVQLLAMTGFATIPGPDLQDEVVVVTGGSRGIGAGSARRFAALGAAVVVSGRDRAALDAVVASITSAGGRAAGIPSDCTQQAGVDRLRAGTEAAFGPATILLAFAGGDGRPEPIAQLDAARWRAVIDANLTATYITVRTFALGMTERGRGSIVTMSSTAGRQPGGASVAYATAKAGIVMLTRHLAVDLAPHGVRINCIAPSAIETERLVELMPAPAREQLGQSFPLRRIGTIDDVAHAALFLATSQSSWITGVTIDVTGGRVTA